MNLFPMTDPIPLPAPVWLFKALDILTLSLHFTAVQILLGGLLVSTCLSAFGISNPRARASAAAMARRLPIVMTYVINLGIPPLLFAQVLYGPALYTSNVLIGVYWFSVIFLLMACYWLLYAFADGTAAGKNVWWKGLMALLLAGCVSRILSTNMALMLRPEDWQGMYSSAALGNRLPPFDPTLTPRWLVMLTGSLWVSGFWMVWIAGRKTTAESLGTFLSGFGGGLASLGILLQLLMFRLVLRLQPPEVSASIQSNHFYHPFELLYYFLGAAAFLFAVFVLARKPRAGWSSLAGALLAFLSIASWVIVRDGIRDLTLKSKGFDVWAQPIVTNWQVVITFLLVFVLGIGAMAWLISVMMRAKPVPEGGARE